MKKVLLVLAVVCFIGQALALTVTKDGILTEWVGNEINNLGTVPAPGGGSYTLLAVWDGTTLNLGIDRDSSNRYLGDTDWENDSFFIAIDVDGIPYSGMTWDGYGRMFFNGPMLPDVVYYYDGGPNFYERSVWNGIDWSWMGWTQDNQYYGWQEGNANDELTPDLVTQVPYISGAHELLVWAWMTREDNGFVEASWPKGHTGFEGQDMDAPVKVRDMATRVALSHDPSPGLYEEDVPVVSLNLSWSVSQNPVGTVNPNLVSHKLYLSDGSASSNLVYVGTITGWNTGTLRASYTPSPALIKDGLYYWRVDTVLTGGTEITGDVWSFNTELTIPEITDITPCQIVNAGTTAVFTVTVESPSTPTYHWYKYVDGISDISLSNGGDISGATTASLSIANAELADEGRYYCIVNNASGVPATSDYALLAVKRKVAYWNFESGNANSTVAGSPVSFLYGDPSFVTTGIYGDAMEFDNDANAEDILYTDPNKTSYFDVCNYSMTVACWIKASYAANWGPIVVRNGEDSQGWQLRHSGNALNRICFTTRGTGNNDGTSSNRTVYDGNWHYAVGTYDGIAKKIYIDGILSRVYSSDDGSIVKEYDEVSNPINSTSSPVALAGRVKGNSSSGLIFEGYSVTHCILDEVEIYNYALDATAIAQIYADMTGTAVCPNKALLMSDLNGDCIVNFKDFTKLAYEWLDNTSVQPAP